MNLRILLADDHKIVRDGLHSLIDQQSGMEVVGEAENGRMAVQLAKQLLPDVIVMDVTMPDLNGIEATRQILAGTPEVKIIGLSMHSDRRFVTGILGAGAAGYLLKDCAFQELIDAVRAVSADKYYLSPGIAGVVVKDYVNQVSTTDALSAEVLTGREREVLQLLAEGKSTKQIASDLFVSVKTIETHRQKIMQKLNIHTIAGLTRYAIREGLTSLEK